MTASPTVPEIFTLTNLQEYYAAGGSPVAVAKEALARIAAWNDPALFISRLSDEDILARARELEAESPSGRALFGMPFVVKDNIDAAGLQTTSSCPAYAYLPDVDSPSVARLREAGAIMIGKTNLDQFATGLVGTRSPYGTPRNAIDPACVPGGSSSGSGTAIAAGLAAFALGTDTAGSGRVPAAFNNIVGLKPTVGLIPTLGVVPACKSLDCVSVFAYTAADAGFVLEIIAGTHEADPYSRPAPEGWRSTGAGLPPAWRLAVPLRPTRVFATAEDAALYDAAIERAKSLGATVEEIDVTPFLDVATRLYSGAWVAERASTLRDLVTRRPETLNPITRKILETGLERQTIDAFDDFHAVTAARLLMRKLFERVDVLMLPTTPGIPTLEEVAADPIGINSRNGTYTNFVNLLDLSGIAVPAGFRPDGRPMGVTFLAPAFSEGLLCAIGGALHYAHEPRLNLGASQTPVPQPQPAAPVAENEIALFCIGAHMSGMPKNNDLVARGGRFLRTAKTARKYRLYAFDKFPGMVKSTTGGACVEGEVWAIPRAKLGSLISRIPVQTSLGNVELEDGPCIGFLCGTADAEQGTEITSIGSWRNYLAQSEANGHRTERAFVGIATANGWSQEHLLPT